MIQSNEQRVKLTFHQDWITTIKYIDEINYLFTGSTDGKICIIEPVHKTVERTFNGHMNHKVSFINWISILKYVCSAGDRDIIIWDPYTLEVISNLETLSPIIGLQISNKNKHIMACCNDKSIKIWHSVTLECLQTLKDNVLYSPEDKVTCLLNIENTNYFYTAGNSISKWNFER